MIRLVLGGGILIVMLATFLTLHSWRARGRHEIVEPSTKDMPELVMLENGQPLLAPRGTVGRDLAEWLSTKPHDPRYLELGGRQFIGRSIEPTTASKQRVDRLATILTAYNHVEVEVVGFTAPSGDRAADIRLSRKRAEWVVDALSRAGIAPFRLSASGMGGTHSLPPRINTGSRVSDERVALLVRPHN